MKKTDIKTVTYDYDDDYRIDIVSLPEEGREAWLYHKAYGVKQLMFGALSETTDEEFLKMVEDNAEYYLADYVEQVIEGV